MHIVGLDAAIITTDIPERIRNIIRRENFFSKYAFKRKYKNAAKAPIPEITAIK